ncbi:MAG: DUF4147 domain-containing protein, partial [Planctomycetes bacterium]|nr:DUF4147 domain-containing protein [Planctomycetota bacterium]
PFEAYPGGHPAPDAGSVAAGRRALDIAAATSGDELLVVLLSGGASALLAAPVEGVSLDDKRATTTRVMKAGADIYALNTVRKHLSRIKGGWLAAAAGAQSITLAVSDVIGDDLSVIGSGPTVPDPTSYADALAVVDRFGGRARCPAAAVHWLEQGARGEVPETPKPGDRRLARATARVIASRLDALAGAREAAEALGYAVAVREEAVIGEARDAARDHLAIASDLAHGLTRPCCVLAAGETTVHVKGRGLGGRNQEFALALAPALGGLGQAAAAASLGTDGIDGPTDAAGAITDSTTIARAMAAGLRDPADYLRDNDSYTFLHGVGDLVVTGPTGTNVGDIQILLFA